MSAKDLDAFLNSLLIPKEALPILPQSNGDDGVVAAKVGEVRICLDFMHDYYSTIKELWIPSPYNICVNYGSSGVMSGDQLHVFASDKPRFKEDGKETTTKNVTLAFAEQCRVYVATRATIEATAKALLCSSSSSS